VGAFTRVMEFVGTVLPVGLLAIVIMAVGVDVAGRNLFSYPVFGTSEIAVLAFVWLVWLGAIGAASRNELLGIHYFVERLPGRFTSPIVLITVDLLTTLIALGTLYAAIMQIRTARFTVFTSINVPKWVMSVALAISMAFIAILFLLRAGRGLKDLRSSGR